MKTNSVAYVWESILNVTNEYHNGGGLLIITSRDPDTVWREYLLDSDERLNPYHDPPNPDAVMDQAEDLAIPVNFEGEKVIVFPDSGCC